MREFAAIVLAAGRGERLRGVAPDTDAPKVLLPLLGRPMVAYVLDSIRGAGIEEITLIVGCGAERVRAALGEVYRYVFQERQLGSGHAVLVAKEELAGLSEHVLVLCGDSPLFTSRTISRLMERHRDSGATITLVSATPDDPSGPPSVARSVAIALERRRLRRTGYGRILRDAAGGIRAIVEEKGASEEIKAIREVNGGAYAFRADWLWANIERMRINSAGELNLTDLVEIAASGGQPVEAITCDAKEILGVNTPEQLTRVERLMSEPRPCDR